jgi:hypothetical protein
MIYQIKIGGVIELDGDLNPDNEYSICLERVGFDPCKGYSSRINKNDVEVRTYRAENLGRVNFLTEKEGKPEIVKGESKKLTKSQLWRLIVEKEDDYEKIMDKMINNQDQVLNFIRGL